MAFRIAHENEDEVLLVRNAWNAPLLLLCTAAAFLLGLAILALVSFSWQRAVLPVGLSVFAVALFLLFWRNHTSLPRSLRLLAKSRQVEVNDRSGRTRLSLADLTDVSVQRRPRGRYAVQLRFGDGATWELGSFAFRRSATPFRNRVSAHVNGKPPSSGTVAAVERLSGGPGFTVGDGGALLVWRERFSAGVLGTANLLFFGVTLSVVGIALAEGIGPHASGFLWGAYLFLQSIGLLAAGAALFLRHEIRIAEDDVEFRTRILTPARERLEQRIEDDATQPSRGLQSTQAEPTAQAPQAADATQPELAFPRARLAAVTLSLEPERGVHRLRLMTPEDLELIEELARGDVSFLRRWQLHRRLQRVVRLPLFGLSFGQALELRAHLFARAR